MATEIEKKPRYTTTQVDVTTTDDFKAGVEELFGEMMKQPEVKAMPQGKELDNAVMACARVVILRDYEDNCEEPVAKEPQESTVGAPTTPYPYGVKPAGTPA